MTKVIALAVAGLFAAGTVFAGDHGSCTKQVGNDQKAACQVSMAELNLTSDQKEKMDALMAQHHKDGCTKESEVKFMKGAEGVLTADQFAKFKSHCKTEKDTKA